MNKYILLVIVLATAMTVGLYTLPKVVVHDSNKQLKASSPGGHTPQTPAAGSSETSSSDNSLVHEKKLTEDQLAQLNKLHADFVKAAPERKEQAGQKIVTLFRELARYDSAAYYAGLVAKAQPTEQNLLRAGDAYFEAYTFAVNEQKTAELGEQTRNFYQQVLAKNPNLLAAKANMAMTYVNTDTPMQGIMLLREVLKQEPNNELALFNLGLLSMRSGQYERAIERFRQILVNNPTSRKAQFYLGVSLAEAGQKAEAKQVLAQVKAQEKDPQILAAVREYEERLSH